MSAPKIPAYLRHKGRRIRRTSISTAAKSIWASTTRPNHMSATAASWRNCWARPAAAPKSSPALRELGLTIVELAAAYWRHAEAYYTKDGQPSGQLPHVRVARAAARDLYGETPAAEFGPLKLKTIQQHFVAKGLARRYINDTVRLVRRAFRWATVEELIPPSVYHALVAVPGLRSVAPPPGSRAHRARRGFNRGGHLAHLSAVVADMVRFQRLTGCRPQEVSLVRPCDVDTTGEIWLYTPHRFKTQHHRRKRVISSGPSEECCAHIYLRDKSAYCFSPAEAYVRKRRNARPGAKAPGALFQG